MLKENRILIKTRGKNWKSHGRRKAWPVLKFITAGNNYGLKVDCVGYTVQSLHKTAKIDRCHKQPVDFIINPYAVKVRKWLLKGVYYLHAFLSFKYQGRYARPNIAVITATIMAMRSP